MHPIGRRILILTICNCCFLLSWISFPQTSFADELNGLLLVQSQRPGAIDYRINEYDADGNVIQTIIPPAAPKSSDLQNPRDLIVNRAGQIQLYNGTFDPYLSTYSPNSDSWSHRTHAGWSTINNGTYGGIAQFNNRVFVTNMSTAGNPSSGLVVLDNSSGNSFEIASGIQATDVTLGLDNSLWVLGGSDLVVEFDPLTLEQGRTVSLAAAIGNDIRSIAVDGEGNFYAGDFGGTISRLDSEGNLLDSLSPGAGSIYDVDVSDTGFLAFGTRLEGAWLTNTDLDPATQIESDRWSSFVTFVRPVTIPEPTSTAVLVAVGLQHGTAPTKLQFDLKRFFWNVRKWNLAKASGNDPSLVWSVLDDHVS